MGKFLDSLVVVVEDVTGVSKWSRCHLTCVIFTWQPDYLESIMEHITYKYLPFHKVSRSKFFNNIIEDQHVDFIKSTLDRIGKHI